MIEYQKVSKKYDDEVLAVKDCSLKVAAGELICLIGPSGCGKTTLLKMTNRLLETSSGKIFFNGIDIKTLDVIKLRRNTGYVIQQIGLLPHFTVGENVLLVPSLDTGNFLQNMFDKKKNNFNIDVDYSKRSLTLMGLDAEEYWNKYPRDLSGGQQQRVGIARALAANPELILMDEPFAALDPISRQQLQKQLKTLHKQLNKTIILVTHDMQEALELADRIVFMENGVIIQIGTAQEFLEKPASQFIADFIARAKFTNC